jgi:hypothetical protein
MKHTNDIIRMAREWLPKAYRDGDVGDEPKFTKHNMEVAFAAGAAAERKRIESRPWGAGTEWIVRAVEAEREACAKVCDRMAVRSNDIRAAALESAAENIRARGQA